MSIFWPLNKYLMIFWEKNTKHILQKYVFRTTRISAFNHIEEENENQNAKTLIHCQRNSSYHLCLSSSIFQIRL